MYISTQKVSKSQFKAYVLQYLREVEQKKQPLTVTHDGRPVIVVYPYEKETVRRWDGNNVSWSPIIR